MILQRFTNKLQDLCHEGFAQRDVAILDFKMHEHTVKDIRIAPNGKVWLMLNSAVSNPYEVIGGEGGEN